MSETSGASPASPKLKRTRSQILTVALKVFAKEGFRSTDVQVIADRAKVGKGTVYRHFGNKQQLFFAVSKDCLERLATYLRNSINEEESKTLTAPVLMRRIARHYAEFYARHPQCVEIMIQERAEFRESVVPSHLVFRAETREEFEVFLRVAIDRGELRPFDVVQGTTVFADLLYGSVVNGCLEGNIDLVERIEQAVDFFIRGIEPKSR